MKLEQIEEIRALEQEGILKAEDVVEFAKDPATALHSAFEWNNAKAAHEHRLSIARKLIVQVTVMPHPDAGVRHIQAYVSLKDDRKYPGGGYRKTVDVMSDTDLRQQLLEQALDEMEYFQNKYHQFEELAKVFREMDRAKGRRRRRKKDEEEDE